MKKLFISFSLIFVLFALSQCDQKAKEEQSAQTEETTNSTEFGGYESQIAYGEHLVTIAGCNDCHTPKKMGPRGPVIDSSLMFSGHPAQMPAPDVNRKEMESKGYAVTQTLTAWVGPWGISYAANLTSDSTGIGNWTETNFITALREGKYKGVMESRPLMPPMPWEMYRHMTDSELKAIFAYLKSTKPIKNKVPDYVPPVTPPPAS